MLSAGRARARGASAERKRLTLIAPPPVRLTRRGGRVQRNEVIAALRSVVISAGGTMARTRAPGIDHRLAVFAPLPVILQSRSGHVRVHEQSAVHTRTEHCDGRADGRAAGTPTAVLLDPSIPID